MFTTCAHDNYRVTACCLYIETSITYLYMCHAPSYREDSLDIHTHNCPKCSYKNTPDIGKLSSLCIHRYLKISGNYQPKKFTLFNLQIKMSLKTSLPSHLLTPSPLNPGGHSHPACFASCKR